MGSLEFVWILIEFLWIPVDSYGIPSDSYGFLRIFCTGCIPTVGNIFFLTSVHLLAQQSRITAAQLPHNFRIMFRPIFASSRLASARSEYPAASDRSLRPPWICMDFFGFLGASGPMDSDGFLWISLYSYGFLWIPIGFSWMFPMYPNAFLSPLSHGSMELLWIPIGFL